jgi:hypothetical protein
MRDLPEVLRVMIEGGETLTQSRTDRGIVIARTVLGDLAEYGHPETRYIQLTAGVSQANGNLAVEYHRYEWRETPKGRQPNSDCITNCWSYAIEPAGHTYALNAGGGILDQHKTAETFPRPGGRYSPLALQMRDRIEDLALGLAGAEPHEDLFNPDNTEARAHAVELIDNGHIILNPVARLALHGVIETY